MTTKGAFQQLAERELEKSKDKSAAWRELREERAQKVRAVAADLVEALAARGGRAAPEPLRHAVRADAYTQKLALDLLLDDGVVERASDGSWRGGDWRLTDQARAALVAQGREIGPELSPRERQAAALAERVLDGLRGDGLSRPILSLRFLRAHIGCGWDPLNLALDLLEREGKVVRVWEGARLRGYRLSIKDDATTVTAAAQAAAPALAEATDDPRAQARLRLSADVLGMLAREGRPVVIAEFREAFRASPPVIKVILNDLVASGHVVQRFHGLRSAGWEITPAGRATVDSTRSLVARGEHPAKAPLFAMTARKMFARYSDQPAAVAVEAPVEPFREDLAGQIMAALADAHPTPMPGGSLWATCGGDTDAWKATVFQLEAAGGIRLVSDGARTLGWVATEAGFAAWQETQGAERPT